MTALPQDLRSFLPSTDAARPAELLDDGRWIVAGTYALIVVSSQGVVDSGMWYEVQTIRWEGERRRAIISWVDPQRLPLVVHTVSEDLASWMQIVTARVERTQVLARSLRDEITGTSIVVQIRRREDGALFSVVTASGALSPEGEASAFACERILREEVGLDELL